MRTSSIVAACILLTATPGLARDPAHPTVVELYQSQGCSSCPPANALVNGIAGRADILALSFAVTYWDQLGWKDIFAKPQYTARQWEYAKAGGRGNVATPQIIVNGKAVVTGSNRQQVVQAIRSADRGTSGPAIGASPGQVTIGAARAAAPAIVWLVRYDPRTVAVPIRAGENGGRTLPHRNIVRALVRLGKWDGKPARFAVQPANAILRSAVLVQQGTGGPIIAASRI